MTNQRPSLRFDHREIGVIFSLFIFISLLMFTVGILVGKGLSQARLDSRPTPALEAPDEPEEARNEHEPEPAKLTPSSEKHEASVPSKHEGSLAKGPDVASPPPPTTVAKAEPPPLELVPKKAQNEDISGKTIREPVSSREATEILKNPKIRDLVEQPEEVAQKETTPFFSALEEKQNRRNPASASAPASGAPSAVERFPASLPKGDFTVQVGSYPAQKDAAERVDTLKKLGFPHAYFSAKQWGDTKEVWYRVWLGFYPDYDTAKRSGDILQRRGEVKNYLVRKTDSNM